MQVALEPEGIEHNGAALEAVDAEHEATGATVRSVVAGGLIGGFVSAGSMYVSFKSGQSLSSSLFCAIVGFAIMKPLSPLLPQWLGGRSGYFGVKENASLQTAGNAASGLSAGFTVAIPVLYWIGFLQPPLTRDLLSLVLWTLAAAYYGLFFAVPLRDMTILRQKLPFPTGTATAHVIRALHEGAKAREKAREEQEQLATGNNGVSSLLDGESETNRLNSTNHSESANNRSESEAVQAVRKSWVLGICFACALLWTILSHFIPVLYNLPIFYYFSLADSNSRVLSWAFMQVHQWRWAFALAPAMLGSGMMMGANVALSLLFGALICWGLLGPTLLYLGWAYSKYGYEGDFVRYPSAQYWLLWPGITIMLVGAFFELFWHWRVVARGLSRAWMDFSAFIAMAARKIRLDIAMLRGNGEVADENEGEEGLTVINQPNGQSVQSDEKEKSQQRETQSLLDSNQPDGFHFHNTNTGAGEKQAENTDETEIDDVDPAPLEERVPMWWWLSGLLVSSAFTIGVLIGLWKIVWYEVILAIVLAFLLSFMSCQVYGETDNNPQGTVAKVSQFVFASFNNNQAINVICGNISLCSAAQSGDMLQDLKTGHVLGASPRAMFIAQIFGSLFGVVSNVFAFCILALAYPCLTILPTPDEPCSFAMPAAQSWFGVSYALTHGFLAAIPPTSAWACLIAAVLTLGLCLARKYVPPNWQKFMPSPLAVGMAFTFPSPNMIFTEAIGGLVMQFWSTFWPSNHSAYGYITAAGLMTGEGIGGLLVALAILVGANWRSSFGLP